jgi:hypothetical protein
MGAIAWVRGCVVASATVTAARAQSFVNAPAQLPSGPAFNAGYTENIDFADVDGDGDRDAVKADGGDGGNEQSRLWINRGFEAGGTIGFFADRTAAQFPAVLATGRDLDFVDVDEDGDYDLYQSNTSTWVSQSDRWWINMGGAQGGTPGFFQDQTASRWTFIAVNNGTTHRSSIPLSQKLMSGGFVDWVCDAVFGDLDNDGDPDLMHSSYGGAFGGQSPSRLFLDDGAGFYEEFNPSGVQLTGTTILNGTPALWCEGTQQHGTTNVTGAQCDIADTPLGVELGDLDGDLDVDILHGARNEMPRTFRNRLVDTGAFSSFRDVTYASGYTSSVTSFGNSEQELGDLDNDDDLDIYGVNWPGFDDVTLKNSGNSLFSSPFTLPSSGADDNDADWFDYDNEGDLDVYVCAFFGQNRLYRNDGSPGYVHANVTATELPAVSDRSLGADSCDVDADGDYDVLVANDGGDPERLYKNVNQIADAVAPRVNHLEQAPNRMAGPSPTVVRVHVYDNASWDVTRYDTVVVEHSWDNVNWYASPMSYSGGQVFRGEIRGDIAGTILYRVRATDEHGNVGVSATLSYVATGCTGNLVAYCTAGTSTSGCVPVISGSGTPSASATSGFSIDVTNLDGQKSGVIFYGINGRNNLVWATGSSSFLCVKVPVQRTGTQISGGTAGLCDGAFGLDWNAYMSSHPMALGQPLMAGLVVDAQAWYRDPPAPKSTNLSGGLEFIVCN